MCLKDVAVKYSTSTTPAFPGLRLQRVTLCTSLRQLVGFGTHFHWTNPEAPKADLLYLAAFEFQPILARCVLQRVGPMNSTGGWVGLHLQDQL